ncbi:hypothetical protein PG985_012684 [Apiospora marii]|uniref:Ecp2 effector protein-like domain-containing protein n=1 Tax=Apiospora marii TaxID=335849 RepID=A0ABR1RCJ0_9PEZI
MFLTLITSLFFCLVSLAAPTMSGFKEYKITRSDGTIATVNFHESFVPDPKMAAAPPAKEVPPISAAEDDPERFIIYFTPDITVERLCKLQERDCTTTENSAVWGDCEVLKTGFEGTPGYWDVSYFQTRDAYNMLGYYGECILSLARDDEYINDNAQLSTKDVGSWMKNAGRSCGVVYPDDVIRVGAKVSLDCPDTDTEDVKSRLKLWIHSPDGEVLSTRAENVIVPTGGNASLAEPEPLPRDFNAVYVPMAGAPPFCTIGSQECDTSDKSPEWEDCLELISTINSAPGYWDMSLWSDQNAYGLLAYWDSCQIYVSRDDANWTLPARIGSRDVVTILEHSHSLCGETYKGVEHVEALWENSCLSTTDGLSAKINVWLHASFT